ncbi:MAG TPA: hypothetical protein PLV42_12300 [bacterium]|nr:hypothetical protein [bacterium]
MRSFLVVTFIAAAALFIVVACASQQAASGDKSEGEKQIALYAEDTLAKGKDIAFLAKLFDLKAQYPDDAEDAIESQFKKLHDTLPKNRLDTFKESPNKELRVAPGQSRLHLKNNYTSGNTAIFIREGNDFVVSEMLPFNTERQIDLKPGSYEFVVIIDRKFNNNKYLYTATLNMSDGTIYVGEFNIASEYNTSGQCPEGRVADEDTCMKVEFRAFDNCAPGTHLVDYLCCDEGYNFVMEGKCSRYTDKVDTVMCPTGYEEGGSGRCCPKGMKFIDGQCQVPPKGWVPPDQPAPADEEKPAEAEKPAE